MKRRWFYLLFLFFISGMFYLFYEKKEESGIREDLMKNTEEFIEKYLVNENGTFATYMKANSKKDSDLVKGREALSESLGIWMEFALSIDDQQRFENAYQLLTTYFLEKDGFVRWKLSESGKNIVSANALVDDLRICAALFEANERWNDQRYEKTAVQISSYLTRYNRNENTLTDYYVKGEEASGTITLSYIEPEALAQLDQRRLIDMKVYSNTMMILKNAPLDGFYYPKSYDVKKEIYQYETEINMVDQSLVAYYRAKQQYPTIEFLELIKNGMKQQKAIFGKYDRLTGKATVEYESPAVYGWLILYSLELKELDLAIDLYNRMIQFKSNDPKYGGGYTVHKGNTHIFDNLVPLMAESELTKWGVLE